MMRAALRRTLLGILLGLVGGGLALMMSLGRASLVGGPEVALQRGQILAPFLVAFGLCGALVGLLAPLRRTALGALGLGLVAAACFVVAIFVGIAGPPTTWTTSSWWAVGTATVLLSVVLAGQLQPSER